jgi:hypothetical protein
VHAALSKNMRLTQRDLKAHLLAKRLIGAARVISPDESERCIIFEPAFWEPVELHYAWLVRGYEKHAREGEAWYFFVRRRELDRLYPVTAASEQPTTPAAQLAHDDVQPAHDDEQPTPQRRKPGRKITKGWRLFAAHAAYEFKEEHGRLPSGPELAQICEDQLGYQPDTSDIAKLLRYLLGD